MTPSQVLDEAKKRFIVLYHSDPVKLEQLLRQALQKYQTKAGAVASVLVSFLEPGYSGLSRTEFIPPVPYFYAPLPDNFLTVQTAKDARGLYHEAMESIDPDTNNPAIMLELQEGVSTSPMTVNYFLNLRDWPLDKDLPNGVASFLLDYLEALIAIPNTERERGVAMQAGQQIDLPSRSELQQRVDLLEQSMEDFATVIFPTATW